MIKLVRMNDPDSLDEKEILNKLKNNNEVIVQYSEPIYNPKSLSLLNRICEESNDNLGIRFYGHYKTGFDCSNLKYLPAVKNLFLDCLHTAINFATIKQLQSLTKLNVGIYEFEEKDFLSWDNLKKITNLCLVDTRNNNIDLKYLEDYVNITTLFINGHIKNIDSVRKLENITNLSLSISSKASIAFINSLSNLKRLKFILGGRKNLDEISNNNVEDLEIIRVKGFSSFKNISQFRKLRTLLIEDQIQLNSIIFENEFPDLIDVKILNCKTFNQLTGLLNLTRLNQLRVYKTNVDFKKFIQQTFPKSLKILAFYTTKKQIDSEIKQRISILGYTDGLEK